VKIALIMIVVFIAVGVVIIMNVILLAVDAVPQLG